MFQSPYHLTHVLEVGPRCSGATGSLPEWGRSVDGAWRTTTNLEGFVLDTQENVETQAQAIAAPGGITMKQLLEAGVHFGHQTKRWNPKMKPYIFGARNGIYIIDLQKTVTLARAAFRFVADVTARGSSVLFVGTKKQAQDVIREEAARAEQFYVTSRWLGGTLTNFRPSSRASTG